MPPIDNAKDLDGNIIFDSSLVRPADFLLSARIPNPSAADLEKPVIVTVHGFSASNFEWKEFQQFADKLGAVHVSRVLLGGHGRTYLDFRAASWHDWQQPVIDECNLLAALGYRKICIAASSTGAPLVLEMIAAKRAQLAAIKHIFLVDPIIVPSDKKLTLIPILGGSVIDYTETQLDPGEVGYWYHYRPQQALRELNNLTITMRKKLEKGLSLPAGMALTVFKSEHDGSADPMSAAVIKNGIPGCDVKMIGSSLHVFTRLAGRSSVTSDDIRRQQDAFTQMYDIAVKL